LALAATSDLFSEEDCATKLLPVICPSLIDKEKVIREQASKTLDIYLQRVKKYSQTLPDSMLPPPSATGSSQSNAPRMGTPQTDTSWAGWAISSFTNKLTAASGEIQAKSSTQQTSQSRPSSEPPPSQTRIDKPGTLNKAGLSISKKSHTVDQPLFTETSLNRTGVSNDEEDFGAEWGGFEEEAKPSLTLASPTSSKNFDDKGEPDFAGWLEAQSKPKQKAKNPLPKGLAKSARPLSRPTVGIRSNTTGHTGARKGPQSPKNDRAVNEVKKEEPSPEEEDAWGDAW
jgi:SCY1-like protein 1